MKFNTKLLFRRLTLISFYRFFFRGGEAATSICSPAFENRKLRMENDNAKIILHWQSQSRSQEGVNT